MYDLKNIKCIGNLRYSKPKEFWKYFNSKSKSKQNIELDDFLKYFSQLGNDIFQARNEEAKRFTSDNDFNDLNGSDEILDK
jgi:hypothetical protein